MPNKTKSAEAIVRAQPDTPDNHVEARLRGLGLTLPAPAKPVAAYVPTRRVTAGGGGPNLLYISGQIPLLEGRLIATGTVPAAVTLEQAQACARQCILNGLAAAKADLGSLDAIKQIVRIGVWVASDPGFTDQPKVANGASELLEQLFGEAGRHTRAAVGAIALPLGAPVEVEMLVEW